MLFAPEPEQRLGHPAAVAAEPVDAGMASRAEGNQPGGGVAPGPPVMHDALTSSPAALAARPVAGEDGVAVAGEVPERAPSFPGTRAAEGGPGRGEAATLRAKQRTLWDRSQESVYAGFLAIRGIITLYKETILRMCA